MIIENPAKHDVGFSHWPSDYTVAGQCGGRRNPRPPAAPPCGPTIKATALWAAARNDKLVGGDGNDKLVGNGGQDILTGGSGGGRHLCSRRAAKRRHPDHRFFRCSTGERRSGCYFYRLRLRWTAGASLTQIDATHWQINSADGHIHDQITIANAAAINAHDWHFV